MQTTSHLLMIRPVRFGYNEQTAVNNAFQTAATDIHTPAKALEEFDTFAQLLSDNGIDVTIVNDTPQPHTPDSIFPNNWISFHADGTIVLYPMYAVNRRAERKPHVLEALQGKFVVENTVDFTSFEGENIFLEGTGSMILDRQNNIAYACLSPRTDINLFERFCHEMRYQPVPFTAVDEAGGEVYHTNVMMCVADKYAVICIDSIADETERNRVLATLQQSGKEIIAITLSQMNRFAGNMLQVHNAKEQRFLIMSSQAYQSLTTEQIAKIESFNPILHATLTTIETNGGGSARCMLAEVFLPVK